MMKRLLFILLLTLPVTLSAQDYILRAGEVYKYDQKTGEWSKNALPINSTLSRTDSIKSYTSFTLEIPLKLTNFLSTRFHTYIKYPKGVRLNEKLQENDNCYTLLKSNVISQGSGELQHLLWIKSHESAPSSMNISIELYDSKSGTLIKDYDAFPASSPMTLSIVNAESTNIFAYVLWKDTSWDSFFPDIHYYGVKISPYCCVERKVKLSGEGEQTVLLLCSKKQISAKMVKALLHKSGNGEYSSDLESCFGHDVAHFNLIQ